MVSEMGDDYSEDMDVEILPSMWPEDLKNESGKQFNVETPGVDQDMLEEVIMMEDPSIVDFKRLLELTNYSEKGSSQLAFLVKHWEYRQANASLLLNEEIRILSKQRQEAELKKLEILEQHRFEEDKYAGDKRAVSILDESYDIWEALPCRKNDAIRHNEKPEVDAEYDTIMYWKQQAMQLEKMLEASIQREHALEEKLQEIIKYLERQSSPVEELSQILKRADNFLHFVLQNAPVVIGHQDKELRYRFIYNHFPSLQEEDIIGRTDIEIFSGAGVKESQDFKKEVMERGLPAKREITFETGLFGSKTFLIHVEPVFCKAGDTIGVNYMGMDITDQVIKREKMARLREQIAVQKAKEKELNRTIHITEETMRAKQMLATMSHEIRSPLSGVVSMAEILANTKLDKEQRQLLDVMLSSGDLVLQLINDILDLSKVESGVMKLEDTKFRPREVVKHVLQTAAASLQKELTLEGHVADDVPMEVIGDVLRIRQILTNLISNAIKFTHEGKVGINLRVVPEQYSRRGEGHQHAVSVKELTEETSSKASQSSCFQESICHGEDNNQYSTTEDGVRKSVEITALMDEDNEKHQHPHDTIVWLCCDVYDTGIGIPEKALPTLFKKYMQVSADHARKYGGTGLGLAICKQLVELMGGHLTVTSREKYGSTFTFELPCKISLMKEPSDHSDELSDMADHEAVSDANTDETNIGYFHFQPNKLGSMTRTKNLPSASKLYNPLEKLKGLSQESYSFPSNNCESRDPTSVEQARSIVGAQQISSELGSLARQDKDPHDENRTGRAKQRHAANGLVMNRYHKSSPDSNTVHSGRDSQHCTRTCTEVSNKAEKGCDGKNGCPSQMHEKSDGSLQCNSHSRLEVSESISQPKILLVEDNKINVMVTQSMMKQLGHTIEVVNNGLEAVRAVQSSRYDLILMDVCMPVMDGLQATRLIRSFEENGNWDAAVEAGIEPPTSHGVDGMSSLKRISIIAMTANALAESAAECLANGMDSFVSKPVTFQKLKHCLQHYLPLNL
ncbi:histidine kinase 5-like [Magnolia sinica]|uniref:histidine kinase 5-like n=1 Tax=Magnolia sinica TaxID=86752 RepID=UPI00265AD267|nr:histidine kinase 5-like [Magnolia sinica]XP_058113846.1 histidine kinase 5-like [Magnolia sinica]